MSLHKMLRAAAGYQAPAPANTDPQFNYVSMLLHGDGTNGSQNNTFVDSSTNNFTITRNGNTTQGSLSPYGSLWSNYFDGSGDYLSTPSNAAFGIDSGDFTIECWVYLNSYTSGATTDIMYGSNNLQNFHIGGTTNSPGKLGYYNGGGLSSSAGDVPLNAWTHIACTRSGSTVRLFRNGAVVATGTVATTSPGAISLTIGGNTTGAYLNGYMSNMRIVKGTALYTSAFTPSTTPLTAVSGTSLLTCQSNRFIDNSANNFTITRNGDVRVTKESPFLPTAAYSTSTIGGSGYFDGNGDYLTVPNTSAFQFGTGDFEVDAWVYQTTLAATVLIDARAGSTASPYTIGWDSSGLPYIYTGSIYTGSSGIRAGQWNHIVWTRASGTLRIFVNGTSVYSASNSDSVTGAGTNVTLCSIVSNGGQALTGYLCDLRIIKGSGVTSVTVPTAPLTAITNTSLLLNFTNAGIFDNAAENDLETVGNAQISTSVKKYGTGSVSFNGSASTYLLTNSGPQVEFGSGNFTIEMWVNFTTAPSSTVGYLLWHPVNHALGFKRLSIYIYANTIGIGYFGTNVAVTSALSWTTGQWYHLAFVRNGNTWTIYRDGTSVASGTDTSTLDAASGYYTGPEINGYIDDLRITKGYARYTANFTPPTAAFPDQ